MRKSLVLMALLTLLVPAGTALAGHSWGGNHWASDNLDMTVSDSGFNAEQTQDMLDEWNSRSPLNARFTSSGKGQIDVTSGRSMLWLGQAQIWIDGSGHISKGRVKMNTTLLAAYDPEATSHVLCQELGHVFGLTHTDGDSCMNDSLSTLGDYPSPNGHDFDMLDQIYDHVDAGGGGDDGGGGGGDCPPKSRSPKCNAPASGRWVTVHTFWAPAGR